MEVRAHFTFWGAFFYKTSKIGRHQKKSANFGTEKRTERRESWQATGVPWVMG
jgi:hypothetical protein